MSTQHFRCFPFSTQNVVDWGLCIKNRFRRWVLSDSRSIVESLSAVLNRWLLFQPQCTVFRTVACQNFLAAGVSRTGKFILYSVPQRLTFRRTTAAYLFCEFCPILAPWLVVQLVSPDAAESRTERFAAAFEELKHNFQAVNLSHCWLFTDTSHGLPQPFPQAYTMAGRHHKKLMPRPL